MCCVVILCAVFIHKHFQWRDKQSLQHNRDIGAKLGKFIEIIDETWRKYWKQLYNFFFTAFMLSFFAAILVWSGKNYMVKNFCASRISEHSEYSIFLIKKYSNGSTRANFCEILWILKREVPSRAYLIYGCIAVLSFSSKCSY